MKKNYMILVLLSCTVFFVASCSKEKEPVEDFSAIKKAWVTGTWKQKDILLGVSTTVSGIPLTEGSSMLTDPTVNMLLTAVFGGNPFLATANNSYVFNADGSYTTSGNLSLIQPAVGNSGTWDLEVYGAVLAFFPADGERVPSWITTIQPSELNLGLTVNIPGLGNVPMNLLLEKQ